MFEREDWMLFRNLDTLGQKAGVSVDKIPAIVAKELVDNALDASGDCRVGIMDTNRFFVEDDGPGIGGEDHEIASLFSIARPLTSTKLLRLPTRGALGNGLRVVVGSVLASIGGYLEVATRGRRLRLTPLHDGTTQHERLEEWTGPGTRIEVCHGEKIQVNAATLNWANDALLMAGQGDRYSGKTSPHWYNHDAFHELLLASNGPTVRDLIAEFDGCSGNAGTIAAPFRGRLANTLDRPEALELLESARGSSRLVKPDRLGRIGEKIPGMDGGYARTVGTFKTAGSKGLLQPDLPFMIEAWAELGDKAGCWISANRTPVSSDVRAFHNPKDLTQAIIGCGLRHAVKKIGRRPVKVRLNIDTPFMPICSDGKSPDLRPLWTSIEATVYKATRRAKTSQPSRVSGPGQTRKSLIMSKIPEAAAKASGEGEIRFSIRQLYYVVRPHFIGVFGGTLDYGYFCQVVGEFEEAQGCDIRGMYRDSRGTLYHPHTGDEIALGTLSAEEYERPAWTFNKILYCEKEGFFPILRAAKFPERFDCALITSKGFASRAIRDVIDLIGDSPEPIKVFCIHDADAYGTMIYESLMEATTARPARSVKIINLGLEPEEGREMGLEVEAITQDKPRELPVARYVSAEDRGWLQSNRIELNAMTSPQFLGWLEEKFLGHKAKVIPPADVLVDRLRDNVQAQIEAHEIAEACRKARVPERVGREMVRIEKSIVAARSSIEGEVGQILDDFPEERWTKAVEVQADAMVEEHQGRPAHR